MADSDSPRFDRRSGLICHVTALPGPYGIGSLDAGAERFVDALAEAGQSLWQICPFNPTTVEYGNSPYSSPSAFAGNPLLVSLDRLHEAGWLDADDLPDRDFDDGDVDFETVTAVKEPLLRLAFERFEQRASDAERQAVADFRAENDWLENYALFAGLKERFDGRTWTEWPEEAKRRDPAAMDRYREELAGELRYRAFVQYEFDRQWTEIREYAHEQGVDIVGDLPIYVGYDSADVWANPDVFLLDDDNVPTHVAGVPPTDDDPFGPQRWGNPIYDWDALAAQEYAWWVRRFERLFDLVDVTRVDHFRGFESYWAIPAAEDDPAVGEWREGPGADLFETVERELDELPVIAEDLGHITPAVHDLREAIGVPGMNLLLDADWCAEDGLYLPHTHEENSVTYTGTHDNDTVVGWWDDLGEEVRECVRSYLDTEGVDVNWALLAAAWESVSVLAIAPLQDVLGLGTEARFNTPGTTDGNWQWRVTDEQLANADLARLRDLTERTGRLR